MAEETSKEVVKGYSITIVILAFVAAWLIQSYRHNAKTRSRVNKAISDTHKEARDAMNALLEEAANNGISLQQFKQTLAEAEKE